MRTVLLVAHVFAAILFIGPSTVATSAFPRFADPAGAPVAVALHRISRAYGTGSLAVAAIGIVLAVDQGLFGQRWIQISLGLFVAATALLLAVVVPAEAAILRRLGAASAGDGPDARRRAGDGDDPDHGPDDGPGDGDAGIAALVMRIRAGAGIYALAWLAILALMIAKP
jgi:hypothetical protein